MESPTMPEKLEEVKKIFAIYLDKNGHRKTLERFIVLEEIYKRTDHFDVESLYFQIRNQNISVSRATVYNTLDLLVECGLVTKHQFQSGQALYEKAYGFKQHDHLICIDCGSVFEFCDPRVAEIQEMIGKLLQFNVSHHSLVLYGNCNKLDCTHKKTS